MEARSLDTLVTSADKALTMLKEGNARYLKGELKPKDSYSADREILKDGQNPFAVVLCCSDSRVSPEIFFDQMLGDLFVVRNAGNIVEQTVLGSIEYAVEHLKTPLVVVCGHSHCGAVTAAHQGGELPQNIKAIADLIQPAVDMGGDVDQVIRKNIELMKMQVERDEIVKHMGARVVGAYYDIHSGVVSFT